MRFRNMSNADIISEIKRNNQEIKRLINRRLPIINNDADEEKSVKNEIIKNMEYYLAAAARGLIAPERDFIIGAAMSYFIDYEDFYKSLYGESIVETRDRMAEYKRRKRI